MADERQNTAVSELLSTMLGQSGVDNVSSTSSVSCTTVSSGAASEWCCIQAIGDAVINTLTAKTDSETGNLNGVTLTGGTTIFGSFTAIQLTSGRVRCYREPKR